MGGTNEDNQRIEEPGELDVLCGRGGMSNHHPGNEWYRRLIKSNRPLYRACPKHTKLLVSKAIVQAVEQQGGRFLEKNRGNGTWYQVTYKRAVDKTSQGLRERDRDDGDGAAVSADSKPIITAPPALRGTSIVKKNPNDAAAFRKPPFKKRTTFADSTKGSDGLESATLAMGGGMPMKKSPPPKKRAPQSLHELQDAPRAKRSKDDPTDTAEEEDFAPLPPTLQQRESSMFRLLKQTKLLVGQSEHWSSGAQAQSVPGMGSVAQPPSGLQQYPPTKLNNLNNDVGVGTQRGGGAAMTNPNLSFRGKSASMLAQQQQSPAMIDSGLLGSQPQFALATGAPGVASAASVPPLTRLTSQMSDWLTSFWPVPTRGESVANPALPNGGNVTARPSDGFGLRSSMVASQAAASQFTNLNSSAMEGANATALANFQKDVAPKLVNIPPPKIDMPPITTVPLTIANKREKMGGSAHSNAAAAVQGSKPNKRKSSPGLPEIPLGGDSAPAPTELEQSVSATLLKLAGSPSKLYSGISSFFGSSSESAGPTRGTSGTLAMPPAAVVGTKRSVGSLMDDDDEVPVEATTITGRRSSRSLMDDDDDEVTRMEERMRGAGSTGFEAQMGAAWRR
eukprot:CAMPEP_0168744014 /NCGR_PEP_ID=MMETSP0724-20121128/13873_1 /TAXON_ID=265536 /ORGANISM="Amphiprora sp., Strain CCMP467" /LENGTH=620 /DNA_ID=CAMNT_0008791661 /DNA_START=164 /DNA_END=2026 /DNA_ORIENTATION=-